MPFPLRDTSYYTMNNNKYHTESYKKKQSEKVDRLYGPVIKHTKNCEACSKEFIWEGRGKTKAYKKARFCSRSCSSSVGGRIKNANLPDSERSYRAICFKYHKKECVVCGEDKIVAVHHYDHNHDNNNPENLVPLCPTHHQYVHSKYNYLVEDKIKKYTGNW